MEFEDAELVGEFVIESNEHLADIENQLLAIEEGGENVDLELVNTVFRGVHSIKGAAGFLGLETIKELAHSLENVLNKIRSEELQPTSKSTDVMLRAGDKLRNLINDAANSNDVDVSEQVAALNEVLSAGSTPPAGQETETESEPTSEVAQEPASDSEVPKPEAPPASETNSATDSAGETTAKPQSSPKSTAEKTTPPNPAKPKAAANASVESSIRVSVGVLDQLMNLAGELVLSRNQLLQAVASNERAVLQAAASELDGVTSNLQEAIMQTRMQPIGNVFSKFPRIVRDLSSQLGKECKLEIEGKEVEVDKTIIEAIGDPLTHLIRNSVDHGVELPQTRTESGKSAEGSVWLRAFHKAGKVCIEIQDDGAGINPEKLKQKAIEKGVLTPERAEQMGDREAVRLIFHPGFSTAEKVSDVSGRGVGMDVVRTNIEKLGGNVDIESEIGVGTNIRVTLPLTLAIIPSMIIKSGDVRYAVPQANVAELVRLRAGEVATKIGHVKSAEVLRLRGSLLPLVRLDRALGTASQDDEREHGPMNIVVVETGQVRYGLIVDGIHDSEEIVVKPLGRHLKDCTSLAGATILGDGRIALILDAAGIANAVGVRLTHDPEEQDNADDSGLAEQSESQSLLLFSSDPTDQFAVPMGVVARIERVTIDQIDSIGGHELLQYRGTSLPLISVDETLDVKPRPDCSRLYVIVFTIGDREVGLIAPQLDDIREVSSDIDSETFRTAGVAGSLVVDDRLIRILDVFQLAEKSNPQWFAETREKVKDEDATPRILLAEDSAFFRRQVAGFLQAEGFEVEEFEDGAAAWNALKSGSVEVDMIVTDIEMPNMNGFELCRCVKQDAGLQHLPMLALTSLSSPEDVAHGKSLGFEDYQVKMHRDNLIRSVRTLLKNAGNPSTNNQFAAIG